MHVQGLKKNAPRPPEPFLPPLPNQDPYFKPMFEADDLSTQKLQERMGKLNPEFKAQTEISDIKKSLSSLTAQIERIAAKLESREEKTSAVETTTIMEQVRNVVKAEIAPLVETQNAIKEKVTLFESFLTSSSLKSEYRRLKPKLTKPKPKPKASTARRSIASSKITQPAGIRRPSVVLTSSVSTRSQSKAARSRTAALPT